ncbi:T9SS type A sorting domain-containing protein [Lewinella sp. 4G2]|uniref:T9SS type A sorting domain-containing protein n=1 Tax=Lewinella sp. 4G2 TaxID=1803372 RepID=UPI0007B49595|nr:T9SS type A sorting domain-containing protein [Lewinella sp. 4G2]OAV43797.1 hypothetical protein A3850_004470 [Lewinella sp. 4G2]
MAYTPLRISVPEPCHEDWNGMTPVDGTTARHCDSCAKNVVDFTGFSDAELRAYTKENGAKICGRFRPDQLGRELRATHKPSYTPLKVAATAAGMLFGSTGLDAQATPTPPPADPIEIDYPEIMGEIAAPLIPELVDTLPPAPPKQLDTPIIQHHMIMGRIATPMSPPPPVPAPTVDSIPAIPPPPPPPPIIIKCGTMPHTETYLPPRIEVDSSGGGETITGNLQVRDIATPPLPPPPPEYDDIETTMGIVYIEPSKPTGWDLVRDTIVDTFSAPDPSARPLSEHPRQRPLAPEYLENVVISPNPMVRKLRLQLTLPETGTLQIELVDARGQLLYELISPVFAGANEITLRPDLPRRHGIIFVRLTDATGARVTRPVVVR